MVELEEERPFGRKTIDSYGIGGFRVEGQLYFGNLFICEDHSQTWANFPEVISLIKKWKNLDLLIIGTGAELSNTDGHYKELSRNFSIGLECLDTPSACRLYNMLTLEGRSLAGVIKNINN